MELRFVDGTIVDPPRNPLAEKWDNLYPLIPIPHLSQVCDGYSCMWCSRCPSGENWKVPKEDKEVYDKYDKELTEYFDSHGGIGNVLIPVNV